jgi:hypothetical protein
MVPAGARLVDGSASAMNQLIYLQTRAFLPLEAGLRAK